MRYPKIRIEFVLTASPVDMFEHQIDVSFQSGDIANSSLVAQRVATTRWMLCASPKYLARAGIPLELQDLREHNCLNFLAGSVPSAWLMQKDGVPATLNVAGNIGSNSAELLRTFAVAGVGIVRLSEVNIAADLATGRLVRVLEKFQAQMEEPIYMLYPTRRNLSPRVRAFLNFVHEKFSTA